MATRGNSVNIRWAEDLFVGSTHRPVAYGPPLGTRFHVPANSRRRTR